MRFIRPTPTGTLFLLPVCHITTTTLPSWPSYPSLVSSCSDGSKLGFHATVHEMKNNLQKTLWFSQYDSRNYFGQHTKTDICELPPYQHPPTAMQTAVNGQKQIKKEQRQKASPPPPKSHNKTQTNQIPKPNQTIQTNIPPPPLQTKSNLYLFWTLQCYITRFTLSRYCYSQRTYQTVWNQMDITTQTS